MDNKSTYLIEHHPEKVKEVLSLIRYLKTVAIVLVFAVIVNFVLMYGLIFYPCEPTPIRCKPLCMVMTCPRSV